MAQSTLIKIFVYGTLKRSQPNYSVLTNTANGLANFLCTGKTNVKFPLVIATRYNIPFLLNRPDNGQCIVGEIYEINNNMLEFLDKFEDHPNLYKRELQDITADDNSVHSCWTYLLRNFPEKLMQLDFIADYRDTKEKPYLERSKRLVHLPPRDDLLYNL